MFRNRAVVFSERLRWKVSVKDGYERDVFDEANPLHLIAVDDFGNYKASVRLLPTCGPNMLRDVFPFLIPNGQVIRDPKIWEASRICVLSNHADTLRTEGLNVALGEIIGGIGETAMELGLREIVAVFDARMLRVLKSIHSVFELIGFSMRIGKTITHLGRFPISHENYECVYKRIGIQGPVLAPGSQKILQQIRETLVEPSGGQRLNRGKHHCTTLLHPPQGDVINSHKTD
jgi:acyl homoserine lactone synthase